MKRAALHFSCLNCIKDVYLELRVRVGVMHHVMGINGNGSGLNFYQVSSGGVHTRPTDRAVHGGEGRNQWKQWGKRLRAEADRGRERAASPNVPPLEPRCKVFVRNRHQGRVKVQDA